MPCTSSQYPDPISPRFCKPCSDLCALARDQLDQCKEKCPDYFKTMKTTTTKVVQTTMTEVVQTTRADDPPQHLSPMVAASVIIIIVLGVLLVGLLIRCAFRKWQTKRRANHRQGIEDEEKGDPEETGPVCRGPVCQESAGSSSATLTS